MSTIEDTKFTDADYIREIAKRYDYPQIADFRAHHARLLRIADRLSAGGGEAVAQAQHDNLHDNIGQAISDVLTDEEIYEIADSPECNPDDRGWGPKFSTLKFARAVLAAHTVAVLTRVALKLKESP